MSIIEHQSYTSIVTSTPIQKVRIDELVDVECQLYFKRDDMTHPHISGNKWRKLKYNIDHVLSHNVKGIVTFGGAFSNHIVAAAAAGKLFGIDIVIYVRGELNDLSNPSLNLCRAYGATLIAMDRGEYRKKHTNEILKPIQARYPYHWIVPEGGSNQMASKGVRELMDEIKRSDYNFDLISVSAGTGGTAAAIIQYADEEQVHVYSSLKGDFLNNDIQQKLTKPRDNWILNTDYHQGGYAKTNSNYIEFINDWYRITNVPLDPIYTGKMVFGIVDLIRKGLLDHRINHLVVHTGGLQGIAAHNYLNGTKYGMINSG